MRAPTQLHATINHLIDDAIQRRIFPGAVVLVAEGPTILHAAAYGTTMYAEPGSTPVALTTIYDIASLTKVFTATVILQLWEQGRIALDTPVCIYLPALRATDVTIWHLLTHTSGLDLRLSLAARAGRTALLDAIMTAPHKQPAGQAAVCTNINSLLLGLIIERLLGLPLDHAISQQICSPLGLSETRFRPSTNLIGRIAPTEIDTEWRNQLVHGSVHDESAHVLHGIAGHAGLFSTAHDLHQFCVAWLVNQPSTLLRTDTIHAATQNHTNGLGLACGLGWMLDRPVMGSAPVGTFGHTGFTGPAIIIEPARQRIVVFLTNRTYPQRSPAQHHAIIAKIVDVAYA